MTLSEFQTITVVAEWRTYGEGGGQQSSVLSPGVGRMAVGLRITKESHPM